MMLMLMLMLMMMMMIDTQERRTINTHLRRPGAMAVGHPGPSSRPPWLIGARDWRRKSCYKVSGLLIREMI